MPVLFLVPPPTSIWSAPRGDEAASKVMEELSLTVGDRRTITLPGLGSAGYQWFATVDDPAVATVEKLGTVPRPGTGPQGSRDEEFEIRAMKSGETVVRFVQRRIFEPGRPPRAQRDIALRVD
jgi:predicted secreted protein